MVVGAGSGRVGAAWGVVGRWDRAGLWSQIEGDNCAQVQGETIETMVKGFQTSCLLVSSRTAW